MINNYNLILEVNERSKTTIGPTTQPWIWETWRVEGCHEQYGPKEDAATIWKNARRGGLRVWRWIGWIRRRRSRPNAIKKVGPIRFEIWESGKRSRSFKEKESRLYWNARLVQRWKVKQKKWSTTKGTEAKRWILRWSWRFGQLNACSWIRRWLGAAPIEK